MVTTFRLFFFFWLAAVGFAQSTTMTAVESQSIERRLTKLEQSAQNSTNTGVALFLAGTFCALWAQNTGRNPWLWFFLGLLFSFITLLVLLYKNAEDREATRTYPQPLTDRFSRSSSGSEPTL